MLIATNFCPFAARRSPKSGVIFSCFAALLLGVCVTPRISHAAPQAQKRSGTGTAKKPLTVADVEKLWKAGNDAILANEIRLKGLGFAPSFEFVDVTLPKDTGLPVASLPSSAGAIRALVPKLDLEDVSSKAPGLFTSLKAAAQKKSDAEMLTLVDPTIMTQKSLVYDLFDPATFKAYTLGKAAENQYGDVGMPFFELNSSNVEKLYYVRLTQFKGKLIIGEFVTGPDVANFYLHDEKAIAKNNLDTMFRALNDGDESGVRNLCTPALYDAIKIWGGNKHAGDRLSHGHTVSQVSVDTTVPLDQKSIRVVTKVSYPFASGNNITFFIDFDRVDNGLKIVRIRDSDNKVIVYDPNIDNYLNRRYGLPDDPPISEPAMTEEDFFLPMDQLRAKVLRTLQYHDQKKISDLAQIFVESDPTNGEGYGIRAAADLMLHKTDKADQDEHKAIDLGGTVYFVVDRYSKSSAKPFTPAVIAITKTKVQYIPAAGYGSPEDIPAASIIEAKFAKGVGAGGFNLLVAGPFLKFQYKGSDGKKKLDYDFADYGTTCPTTDKLPADMIEAPSNGTCGSTSTNGQASGAQMISILTPQTWREDLAIVADAINAARGGKK